MSGAPARIAVVEDEPTLRETVGTALRSAGYLVKTWADGRDEQALSVFAADLVILDVMLPGVDGFTLGRRMLDRRDVAVLYLTARGAVEDRLLGFSLGADDYVVKPVMMEELLARVRAVLRRAGKAQSAAVSVGDLVVDEDAAAVTYGGEPVELTAMELRLLSYLARHRGRTHSKLQLLTQVWGYDAYDPNLVEVHMSALRRKLEAHGPRMIHTVRGVGYRLAPPVRQ